MKIIAIIQARMGSTRLPGKVMMTLKGKTVLEHVISRVSKASIINKIVVATSALPQDDVIENEVLRMGAACYRGSESDVLARYFDAAKMYNADIIIRICSDCPLLDPALLNDMGKMFLSYLNKESRVEYLSNCLSRTYPRGLDVEIFTMRALQRAYVEASLDYQREHVTPYIYQNPTLFVLHHYVSDNNLSHLRWTLDTPEDFEFINHVYDELYKEDIFTTNELLELLKKKPWLAEINKHVMQKEIVLLKEVANVGK